MIMTYVLDSRTYESDDALSVDLDNLVNEREMGKRKLTRLDFVKFTHSVDKERADYYRVFVVMEETPARPRRRKKP